MSDIPVAPGIYKITCIVTKKIYIGSAANLCKRRREHLCGLRHNKHRNRYLQRAWNKYGEDAFTFEVLELVLPISLTAREQYWFKKLKPFGKRGFNIDRIAGSTYGRKVSPETREKLRQSHLGQKRSPETIDKFKQVITGRKRSPKTIEKVRQSNLGKKRSLQERERMKQYNRGKSTPKAIEAMRQANLGRKKSPEEIENWKQARLARKREQVSA